MDKKSNLGTILGIVGAVVVVAAVAVAMIHFWDDIKKLFPCCKGQDDELEEFSDIEA